MIVIGSEFVPFSKVELYPFSKENLKKEFVLVGSKIQAVLANANNVKFVVCDNLELACELQSVANDYLFDSKIALIINDQEIFDLAIQKRIDAVIFKEAIENANF